MLSAGMIFFRLNKVTLSHTPLYLSELSADGFLLGFPCFLMIQIMTMMRTTTREPPTAKPIIGILTPVIKATEQIE